MPKIDKRYISLDPSDPNSVTAEVIFYNSSLTIKQKIDGLEDQIGEGELQFIHTPTIINPSDGAIDFYGSIVSTAFETSDNFYGDHESSDWEIAADSNFDNIIEFSYDDPANLTSYTPNSLSPGTTYYVRVRYKSEGFTSDWSNPVSFTTTTSYIQTPIISCNTGDSLYPVFHLTPFQAFGYSDSWSSTVWEIARDPQFTNLVYSITDSSQPDILSIDTDILDINTTYYIRAKYNGTEGHSSNWSNIYTLTTGLYKLEYTIPPVCMVGETISFSVYHDNNRTFNPNLYFLNGYVSVGTLLIHNMSVDWILPDNLESSDQSITLWVEKFSGIRVTDIKTEHTHVYTVEEGAESVVSIHDFSSYEYNDQWTEEPFHGDRPVIPQESADNIYNIDDLSDNTYNDGWSI